MTLDPMERITALLEGVTGGHGRYRAKCPAHEDSHASLSIGRGNDGRALVTCHAGCDLKAILAALGLTERDLFADGGAKAAPREPPKPSPVHAAVDEAARALARSMRGTHAGRIVTTYPYRDAAGALLFEVVRYEPKGFRQRRPDGKGAWSWNLNGTRRVLYRLPELLAAAPAVWVFIVEGEKDADNLAAMGLVATTNPGGAGKWRRLSDDSALHGRRVCIVADKDAAGRAHAQDVARRLHGKAADVRIVELPGDGKDASDWIEAHDAQDPADLAAELVALAGTAPRGAFAWEVASHDDAMLRRSAERLQRQVDGYQGTAGDVADYALAIQMVAR